MKMSSPYLTATPLASNRVFLKLLPCVFLLLGSLGFSQSPIYTYVEGHSLRLFGKAEMVPEEQYLRIPREEMQGLPERLQNLAQNTAGIHIDFKTDSRSIAVKWELNSYMELQNMTPIAVNGLDLYGYRDGKWQFVTAGRPTGTENSAVLIRNLDGESRNYRLYLPLYTGVKNLQIGVEEGAEISKSDSLTLRELRILIYGSSITQGASASRSGMTFPAILSRNLDVEILNFGFSGSGKMEPEMAGIIKEVKTDIIVLDCVANPSPEQIEARAVPFVEILRKAQPDTPIVMVESIFREHGHWDQQIKEHVTAQNRNFREAYEKLTEAGVENLYYVSSEGLIGSDHEATIDGTHFTDLGHLRMANNLEPILKLLLESR